MKVLYSISIFILAGLCEIGGGYMVLFWLKEQKHWWYGVVGGLILILYGIVATLQPLIQLSQCRLLKINYLMQ